MTYIEIAGWGITPDKPTSARITVLTPEKLGAKLRARSMGYGGSVFDVCI